jgi:hypothetical protein
MRSPAFTRADATEKHFTLEDEVFFSLCPVESLVEMVGYDRECNSSHLRAVLMPLLAQTRARLAGLMSCVKEHVGVIRMEYRGPLESPKQYLFAELKPIPRETTGHAAPRTMGLHGFESAVIDLGCVRAKLQFLVEHVTSQPINSMEGEELKGFLLSVEDIAQELSLAHDKLARQYALAKGAGEEARP